MTGRPNIILTIADDQRFDTIAAPAQRDPQETANLAAGKKHQPTLRCLRLALRQILARQRDPWLL